MKFGMATQNHTHDADDDENVKVETPKREVEFQYGCRLFSETGNSNISAAD